MNVTADRKYSATHEWFKLDGDLITVGITKFAADELTDITYVDLPKPGTAIEAGKPFGEIESVKATAELVSAIAGTVAEVNAELADSPELINSDSFDRGWMIKIQTEDRTPLDALMDADTYTQHCTAEAH